MIESVFKPEVKCLLFFFLRVNKDDVGNVDAPDAEGTGQRVKRDTQEQDRINDYVSKKARRTAVQPDLAAYKSPAN